jgi:hypothetical protein
MNEDLIVRIATKYLRDADVTSFTSWDLLHAHGSPLWALAYGSLFWPAFAKIETAVILQQYAEDEDDRQAVRNLIATTSVREAERRTNLTEVALLFGRRADDGSDQDYAQLATIIRSSWTAKLRQDFPDISWTVEILPASSLEETAVTFCRTSS